MAYLERAGLPKRQHVRGLVDLPAAAVEHSHVGLVHELQPNAVATTGGGVRGSGAHEARAHFS